jgi:hypothetical protein
MSMGEERVQKQILMGKIDKEALGVSKGDTAKQTLTQSLMQDVKALELEQQEWKSVAGQGPTKWRSYIQEASEKFQEKWIKKKIDERNMKIYNDIMEGRVSFGY